MTTPDPAGNGSKRPRAGSEPGPKPGAEPGPAAGAEPGGPDPPDAEAASHPSGVPADADPPAEPRYADPLTLAAPEGELPAGMADLPGEPTVADLGAHPPANTTDLPGEPRAGATDPGVQPLAGAADLGDEPTGGRADLGELPGGTADLTAEPPAGPATGMPTAGAGGYPPIPVLPVEPPPTLADRASGSSPDETPTAPQPTVTGRPRPPDWSTPDTPAIAPPLSGRAEPDPAPAESGASDAPPPGSQPPGSQPPGPPGRTPPGPPHPPGPPPSGPAVAPTPPTRRILWLVLGLAAALILCCWAAVIGGVVAWGNDLFGQIDGGRNSVGLNEAARDGQLEFRVTRVECGVPRVGDQLVNEVATGQFCLVQVTVRNRGNRPVTFDDSLQRAYGSGDRQFVLDQTAGMIANAAQPLFLAPINPGNQVDTILVYDIPTDARLLRLRLRATTDSRGVLVKL